MAMSGNESMKELSYKNIQLLIELRKLDNERKKLDLELQKN